jgi:hypothetical protein
VRSRQPGRTRARNLVDVTTVPAVGVVAVPRMTRLTVERPFQPDPPESAGTSSASRLPLRNPAGDPRRATGPCAGGGARRRGSCPATSDLGVRVRVRGFLRKIVSDAALKSPVRINAREFHRRSNRLRMVRHWHHPSRNALRRVIQVSPTQTSDAEVPSGPPVGGPEVAPFEARPLPD